MMKMEYGIIRGVSLDDLEEAMDLNMEEGWMPQGGVCMIDAHEYWQAVIREKKDEPIDQE